MKSSSPKKYTVNLTDVPPQGKNVKRDEFSRDTSGLNNKNDVWNEQYSRNESKDFSEESGNFKRRQNINEERNKSQDNKTRLRFNE